MQKNINIWWSANLPPKIGIRADGELCVYMYCFTLDSMRKSFIFAADFSA